MDKGKEIINEPFWIHPEGVPELIYINKEALPQKKERGFFLDDNFNAGWNACLTEIFKIPAADVRPVVRGRWVTRPYMMGQTEYCSRCGENYRRKHNFCPNCGADMRKEINYCEQCQHWKNSNTPCQWDYMYNIKDYYYDCTDFIRKEDNND